MRGPSSRQDQNLDAVALLHLHHPFGYDDQRVGPAQGGDLVRTLAGQRGDRTLGRVQHPADGEALGDLLARYEKAGGRFMVCPICFNAKQLDKGSLLPNAELAGTVQLWEWIGDDGATTFSY